MDSDPGIVAELGVIDWVDRASASIDVTQWAAIEDELRRHETRPGFRRKQVNS